jgi:hypothetical protein
MFGDKCQFHLCTVVGKYIISTVGDLFIDGKRREIQGSGPHSFFETMVFLAGNPCDAPGCQCGQPNLKDAMELDCRRYTSGKEAHEGHMEMCRKWAKSK